MIKPIIPESRLHRNHCVRVATISRGAPMTPACPQTGEDGLERSLREYVEQLPDLPADKRRRLLEMALELHARRLPTPFVFSSIRAPAAILTEMAREAPGDAVMERPEVRDFIEANGVAPGDGAEID